MKYEATKSTIVFIFYIILLCRELNSLHTLRYNNYYNYTTTTTTLHRSIQPQHFHLASNPAAVKPTIMVLIM